MAIPFVLLTKFEGEESGLYLCTRNCHCHARQPDYCTSMGELHELAESGLSCCQLVHPLDEGELFMTNLS